MISNPIRFAFAFILLCLSLLSGCATTEIADLRRRLAEQDQQLRDAYRVMYGSDGTPQGDATAERNRREQQLRSMSLQGQRNASQPAAGVGGGVLVIPETNGYTVVPQQPMAVTAASLGGPPMGADSREILTLFAYQNMPNTLAVLEVNGYAVPVQGGGGPVAIRDEYGRAIYGVPGGTNAYLVLTTPQAIQVRYQCYFIPSAAARVPGQPIVARRMGGPRFVVGWFRPGNMANQGDITCN